MKKILTLLAVVAIVLLGCAEPNVVKPGDPVTPIPAFEHPKTHLEPTNTGMDFSCAETPDVWAGRVSSFKGHVADDHENDRYFTLWVFHTGDSVLTEDLPSGDIDNIWFDYGSDKKPEYYFDDPYDVPGFPDLCAGVEHLRKK